MFFRTPKRGDVVVYRKTKFGERPGPRAKQVYPTRGGDNYTYHVDKYWVVAAVDENGQLVLKTRTGKTHTIGLKDPLLRSLSWWQRWLQKNHLPSLEEVEAAERERLRDSELQRTVEAQSA